MSHLGRQFQLVAVAVAVNCLLMRLRRRDAA
jgi:hypothetical protein